MGLFSKKEVSYETKKVTSSEIFLNILKEMSGDPSQIKRKYNIFYRIYGFMGIHDGVGCSTIVANTALALADLGLSVCVIDTSYLSPVQECLLKTTYEYKANQKSTDFLNSVVDNKPLTVSKLSSKINVLSIRDRSIINMVSSEDSAEVMENMFKTLLSSFDIILVDLNHEPTEITSVCLHRCQKIFQVWDNSQVTFSLIENFFRNCAIRCCPLGKMTNIILNKVVDDVPTDWKSIFNKYRLSHIATIPLAIDIARCGATGDTLFRVASESNSITKFNECITTIISLILNLEDNYEQKDEEVDLEQTDLEKRHKIGGVF